MMPFARYFCIFINVGLGEGSALPVGVPVPWPSATPPTGWLKCNGAVFSSEKYWFGRRFGITRWRACSVAFRHSANRLAEMQRCRFFC
ncbi:tail fiber protein [Escherichia coli]|nr:tail fiber protein [Escherichia coli]